MKSVGYVMILPATPVEVTGAYMTPMKVARTALSAGKS